MSLTETTAASLATATVIASASSVLPAALLLPICSIAAIAAGFAIALFAWMRASRKDTVYINSWDVSGGLLLAGFAAALMSNPEAALAAFDQAAELTTASLSR